MPSFDPPVPSAGRSTRTAALLAFQLHHVIRRARIAPTAFESASLSLLNPRAKSPCLAVLSGDCEFRDGTDIRGIGDKIDKEVGNVGGAGGVRLALTKGD